MAVYAKKIRVQRINAPTGVMLIVYANPIVRVAATYPFEERGGVRWYAEVADFLGPETTPQVARIPPLGGYADIDTIERVLVDEAQHGIFHVYGI